MKEKEFNSLKILYVEDEDFIRKNAVSYLNRLFDEVLEAKDAFEALELIKNKKPDIIMTDIKMPKMNGIDLVRKIRENDKTTQIIILSAFTDTSYLLEAVELGLVKYLIKPIRHEKIMPVFRQCVSIIQNKKTNIRFISETCIYDMFNKILVIDEKIIKLSKNELEFLNLLCEHDDKIVSYEEIENRIWYYNSMSTDALRSLVRNLRRKLPIDTLQNIAKLGYKIDFIK